jgi:hypothetical protein
MSFGATFLLHPDRFPGRDEGDAWGRCEATLDLPGGPYRLRGLSSTQESAVLETFAASTIGSRQAPAPAAAAGVAVAVTLRRCAKDDFAPVDTRGWDYALDFDFTPSTVRLAGLGLMARIDGLHAGSGPKTGPERLTAALWTPAGGGALFPGIFENFLRVLAAYRLLDLGGAILHSAGLVKNGAAYLLLGRSGAGKTTVSALAQAQGGEVLSDDLNALCPDRAAGCLVHKLPFTGEIGDRRAVRPPVPLAGLLRLEKDVRDELLPLSRAQAVASMMMCAPFVNADPCRRERLERVLLDLLAAGAPPAFILRFSLSGAFWSILSLDQKATSAS